MELLAVLVLDGVIGSSVLITPPLHQPNIVIYVHRRCNLIFLFIFLFFWPFGMISKIMQLGALFQLPTGGEGFSAHAPSKGCFQASVGGPFQDRIIAVRNGYRLSGSTCLSIACSVSFSHPRKHRQIDLQHSFKQSVSSDAHRVKVACQQPHCALAYTR